MAGSIGNAQLKIKLEAKLVDLACKKNECLCDGKDVEEINYDLSATYNWWIMSYACDFTDAQINCIVSELSLLGGVIETPEPLDAQDPQAISLQAPQTGRTLNCTIALTEHTHATGTCSNVVNDGTHSVHVDAYGGQSPYTFAWTAVSFLSGGKNCFLGDFTSFGLTGLASDTLSATTASAHPVKYTCLITDSLGSTAQCEIVITQ